MNEKGRANKHMTLEDRIEIQECLGKGMTFKAIARRIEKDPTTVSKEVKARAKSHTNSFTKTDTVCPQLLKAPFVCNDCLRRSRSNCNYARRVYAAIAAHTEYKTTLRESREGIPLNKETFYETEQILSAAVRSGQHIYHAIMANQLPVSKSSVYRHIARGYYKYSRSLLSLYVLPAHSARVLHHF
ncbi:MAG: helix-turn-helix domain-containing protein [Oscillospiraceae bacterium]|jgi:IS30 family transposase|nr:helix-turn-helix domain-containing protein [Oscillospiraceae bacterium]